jgi:GT2 family glycosyltransferase
MQRHPRDDGVFVSVIIPHFNDFANLALCLEALRRQSWPPAQREIIVADNNSDGGLARVAALAGDHIRVVAAPEQGAGPARNAGVAASQGEVLAFIDSDCIAAPDWLAKGVAALGRFDYAGGRVMTRYRDPAAVTAAEAYEAVFAFDFEKYITKDRFSGTGNLFVPRRVFAAVGGFRTGVSEDMDWCRRANALGFTLGYAPDALVTHAARRDWCDLTRKWRRIVTERRLLAMEWPGWRLRWMLYAVAVALSPFPHALRVLTNRALPGWRAKLMGLIGLVGIREYRAWLMLRPSAERRDRAARL